MNKQLITIFTTAALACLTSTSTAATQPWMKEVNTGAPGPYLKTRPINLAYQLSWKGAVNSGVMNFIFNKPDPRFPKNTVCQAYGKSTGVAAGLFPYTFNYGSILRKSDYRPLSFQANEADKKETKVTSNRYTSSSVTTTETETDKRSGKATTKKEKFNFPNTLDLMSAMLYIRSHDLKAGQTHTLVVKPFDSAYLIKAKVVGKTTHLRKPAFKIDLTMKKIQDDMTLGTYKKMKNATIWISDDADRVPLELRVKAYIGDVRATLASKKHL